MEYIQEYQSPLGEITLASDGEYLTGLWFKGQKYYGASLEPEVQEKELTVFVQTRHWLDLYFRGEEPDFLPPLRMKTTPFRREVWEILLSIPYGKTMTYGEIASLIARKKGISSMSAQAVGGAVGHNAISLIIPCHRVVGTNGSLTGYAGGIEKKISLLMLEGTDMTGLCVPEQSEKKAMAGTEEKV
ncbi:MAG: methylated-DNA--[protein]-cysteine S-methyltransferase [Lachnospiraceae bacterium]|nr:methylated-DNA--[protein]-cysteine S-methyltransferase [Lachnospiraceae bacterium]